MAEISGFHNSRNGDRRVKADFFARFFGSLIGNGVFPNPSTSLQVIANGDMTVTVKAGKGWVNGVFYENTADMALTLEIADGVLKRIDRVVLQYSTIDRTIAAKVKKGTFASSPVAPSLQRDADMWELGIADIYVASGAVSISQANITDLRLNNSYCGIVHGVVDQVDTTTLWIQYSDAFNEWFSTIKTALEGDVAANLLAMIVENSDDLTELDGRLSDKTTTVILSVNWNGESEPYTQSISNVNVTETNTIEISLASTATSEETLAFDKLGLKSGGQSLGNFTLRCWGEKNTIPIPIEVSVRG